MVLKASRDLLSRALMASHSVQFQNRAMASRISRHFQAPVRCRPSPHQISRPRREGRCLVARAGAIPSKGRGRRLLTRSRCLSPARVMDAWGSGVVFTDFTVNVGYDPTALNWGRRDKKE